LQEAEAESYEARLKSKESEAVKAAEEGFKIRFGEQVRLVRDLGDQLTAMEHKRDEALAAAKAQYHTEIQRMRLLTSRAVAEKAEFFSDMERIKQANSKGIEELEAMKHERDEADDKLKSIREELTAAKSDIEEQRRIAKAAVEKLAEMEKTKVSVNCFAVFVYLLTCA
jgi:hypothetical protein